MMAFIFNQFISHQRHLTTTNKKRVRVKLLNSSVNVRVELVAWEMRGTEIVEIGD